ncbi:STAS domain-containing protein [Azospirillum sp. SYSU D00513]|uniref:STAS domain-containing protein n=1 Tax=Azospirillum sp. SYSU D00513 TaxID=2812561 RepID=UPI001A96ACB3|nr:STAS domain-containing protein [Azospirillum sp. SYSU D00513]
MNINENTKGDTLILALSGRLDSSSSKTLDDLLTDRVQKSDSVIVDFKEVQYVSSAGLRILLKAAKIAKGTGHKLALARLAPQIREVFDISGFTSIFTILDELPE